MIDPFHTELPPGLVEATMERIRQTAIETARQCTSKTMEPKTAMLHVAECPKCQALLAAADLPTQ